MRVADHPPGLHHAPDTGTSMRHRHHRHRKRRPTPITPFVVLGLCAATLTASQASAQEPSIAPMGAVAVSSVGAGSFDVDWTRPQGADRSRLVVATDASMQRVVWTTGTSAVSAHAHVDDVLTEGSTYFVQVTPTVHGRAGLPSDVQDVMTGYRLPGYLDEVHVRDVGTGGFTASWDAPSDATAYQVVASAHADLSDPFVDRQVSETSARIPAPTDGARYYVSVLPLRAGRESAPTRASVTLPLKQLGLVRTPVAQPRSDGSFEVRWPRVANATGYRVSLATSAHGRAVWTSAPTRGTSITTPGGVARSLRGVVWVRVTADRFGRVARTSGAVPTVRVGGEVTGADPALTLRVASYNLLGPQYPARDHASWKKRFAAEGRALRNFDVVGVQEAPQSYDGGSPQKIVAARAGLTVARKPGSSKDCTPGNAPILYDAGRFHLESCGSVRVSDTGRDQKRYVTWAVLRDGRTHRSIFVANTHLTAHLEGAGTRAAEAERLRQARRVAATIAKHNRSHLPVVLFGDLNSYLGSAATTPVDVFAKAGLADGELTANRLVGTRWNSYHGFHRTKQSGHHLDHVLTSGGTRVESLAVLRTDERRAPSDHHRIAAVVAIG